MKIKQKIVIMGIWLIGLIALTYAMPGDKFFESQDLSKDQIAQLQKLRKQQGKGNKEIFTALEKKHEQLEKTLFQANINQTEVTKIINETKELNGQLVEIHLKEIVSLREVLGPDLFKKFTQEMRQDRKRGMFRFKHLENNNKEQKGGELPPPPPPEGDKF